MVTFDKLESYTPHVSLGAEATNMIGYHVLPTHLGDAMVLIQQVPAEDGCPQGGVEREQGLTRQTPGHISEQTNFSAKS